MMTDAEKIARVRESFAALTKLHEEKRETMALMVRTCVTRLKSPDSRKRAEAIKVLDELATMLEGRG